MGRVMLRLILIVCSLQLAAGARAEEIQAGGVTVLLELPAAYCRLTKNNPAERFILELQARMHSGDNQVLLVAAPCADIPKIRGGAPMYEFVVWLIPESDGTPLKLPPTMTREALIEINVKGGSDARQRKACFRDKRRL